MTHPLRASVAELVELGRMPTTEQADAQPLRADRWEALVGQVLGEGALTEGEAAALAHLFPADDSDCYGVAWTLVHVIEATPSWPLPAALDSVEGPWGRLLEERVGVAQGD